MKSKSTLTAGAIISALIGVLIGFFIKNLPNNFTFTEILNIIFVIFGIFTLFSSIPELLISLSFISSPFGKLSFISACLGTASGLILIFYHNRIILPIIAAYLVIFPLIQIIFSRSHGERARNVKALLPKIILGVLLVVFFPAASGIADKLFKIILTVIGWAIIVISVALALTFIISINARSNTGKSDKQTIYLDDEDFSEK